MTHQPGDDAPTAPIPVPAPALRTTSLRRRVTVLAVAVLALVLFGVVLTVDQVFAAQSNRDLGAILVDHERIAQQLANNRAAPQQLVNKAGGQGVRARLVLADGRVLDSLGTDAQLPVDPKVARSATVTLRSAGLLGGARLTLVVEASVITNAQTQLRRILLLVGFCALVVTAIALVVAVRLALRPLDDMARLARSTARGDRGRRLAPTRTDTEIGRTASAFDDMLDALEGAERQARAAEAVSRRAEAVSRASEERTRRFVADAAHELRTPIAGVQAAAEAVLQQSPDAPTEDRDRLHLLLVRESRRAGQLVNDLLNLARLDAGVRPSRSRVDLRELVEAQAERCRLLAPAVTVDVLGPSVDVPADAAMITQVVANLLDNARHATPADGRITATLRPLDGDRSGTGAFPTDRLDAGGLTTRRFGVGQPDGPMDGGRAAGPGFAELVVTDSGDGVPAADRERIFDRLVRLDSARDRRSGGSGLGLPIARGFARAHGGDLTCEPPQADGGGAVFRLVLPTSDDPAAATARLPVGVRPT